MLIRVAVPVPALDLLTYLVPDSAPPPSVGARVVVPLGSRTVTGIVVETGVGAEGMEGAVLKSVTQILDDVPFVPSDVVELARWTADYYAAGIGDTLTAVLPPMARGVRADAHKTRQVAFATDEGRRLLAAGGDPPRPAAAAAGKPLTARQRETLAWLASSPAPVPVAALASEGISADVVTRLSKQGFVRIERERLDRDPF
ncbi:MAG: hypothetical protein AB7P22_08390, partial [Vicinamibacterales bacterium]